MADKEVAVIAGVGEGLGKALAARFAKGGFEVVIASRDKQKLDRIAKDIGEGIHVVPTDVTDPKSVKAMFDEAEKIGPLGVAVFNAGNMHAQELLEVEPAMFEQVWRVTCFAGFLVAQEAARRMLPNKQGTILFTGATASMRGRPMTVTFASAKAGLRSVAQSVARAFGPEGIHTAHVVIDGVIDTQSIKEKMPDVYKRMSAAGTLMDPAEIAEVYYALHEQAKSAWTFETDIRPGAESF